MLLKECKTILFSIDQFAHPSDLFTVIQSAAATLLIIFCARKGGEPIGLQLYQWKEAVNGEWVGNDDEPDNFDMKTMLITYQTGKGSNHQVLVLFLSESIQAMKFLRDSQIRKEAGVNEANPCIFTTTQHSRSHASSWHCINDMLIRHSRKGTINATKNRHRVASLLSKLQLSEKEKDLIFKHFGHSHHINKGIYQAPPGAVQIQMIGQKLLEINEFTNHNDANVNTGSKVFCKAGNLNFFYFLFKGYFSNKTITSQNFSSEAQVRNFFIS